MKQFFVVAVCLLQFLHATPAFAGQNDQIAKYVNYPDLRVAGRTFYTADLKKFYSQRGYAPVWFSYGQSNYKMEIYLNHATSAYDMDSDNRRNWLPILEEYADQGGETWITTELVGTYSLLTYLKNRGVTNYAALNKALDGDGYDLQYYLKSLKVRTDMGSLGSAPEPKKNGGIFDTLGGWFGGNEDSETQAPEALEPAHPIDGTMAVVAIGTSNARYANDPVAADVSGLYQGSTQSLWIDGASRPNQMAAALKEVLREAALQGLNPDDYWDVNLENLYRTGGAEFESRASQALVRYVTHLSRGRLNPQLIDSVNLKFQMKKFDEMKALNAVVRGSPSDFKASIQAFAPQIFQYQRLVQVLRRLILVRDTGAWKKISEPGRSLKMGDTSPTIGAIRLRLDQLGYPGVGSGNVYDSQFAAAVKLFLSSNGLPGTIESRFWNNLSKGVDERIRQVGLNMEKLRWFPKDSRTRFAFVNLAAQEFRLMDNGQQVMKFRTVNGRADRKTPSMMQQIRSVILNPTWTVPPKLALADEIPAIRKDPNFMRSHNMYILDAYTKQYYYDISQVDMTKFTDSSTTTRYYFVQGPGNLNALGVIKFPLSNMDGSPNSDDIYLHDTNQRDFFGLADRYKSSGCIRLQMPTEFGAQLLADKGMTLDDIRARVPWDDASAVVPQDQTNQQISLPKPLPVYILYLTAEQSDEGGARLLDDTYGLDAKILEALKASI